MNHRYINVLLRKKMTFNLIHEKMLGGNITKQNFEIVQFAHKTLVNFLFNLDDWQNLISYLYAVEFGFKWKNGWLCH